MCPMMLRAIEKSLADNVGRSCYIWTVREVLTEKMPHEQRPEGTGQGCCEDIRAEGPSRGSMPGGSRKPGAGA